MSMDRSLLNFPSRHREIGRWINLRALRPGNDDSRMPLNTRPFWVKRKRKHPALSWKNSWRGQPRLFETVLILQFSHWHRLLFNFDLKYVTCCFKWFFFDIWSGCHDAYHDLHALSMIRFWCGNCFQLEYLNHSCVGIVFMPLLRSAVHKKLHY